MQNHAEYSDFQQIRQNWYFNSWLLYLVLKLAASSLESNTTISYINIELGQKNIFPRKFCQIFIKKQISLFSLQFRENAYKNSY